MEVKYKQIAEIIESNILVGKYNDTKKLPTEEELMKEFDVSRNTIRKAIGTLVDRGHIYQVQGSGIFIREISKEGCINLGRIKGLTGETTLNNIVTKMLELKIVKADEELAKKMKCDLGTNLYFVKRLRYVDNVAFTIECSYYNKDIIPYLNQEIIEKSIYDYITNDLKFNIGFADKMIYSDKLEADEAELLCLNEGDPSLIIEDTVFLTNGYIFDISKVTYNYKNAKLLSLANFK